MMNKTQIMKATPEEIIKEFRLDYAEHDGKKGFSVPGKRPGKLQIEALTERKPEIMVVLEARKAERDHLAAKREAKRQSDIIAADASINDETVLTLIKDTVYIVCCKGIRESSKLKALETRLDEIDNYDTKSDELLKPYKTDTDLGDYTITEYYEMNYGQIIKVIDQLDARVVEKKAEIEAKKQKKDAAMAEKINEAKKTGKPVILRQWEEDCNDPSEECNMDIVIEYAMPDETRKIIRSHTW